MLGTQRTLTNVRKIKTGLGYGDVSREEQRDPEEKAFHIKESSGTFFFLPQRYFQWKME